LSPRISIVANFYNMRREAARTLHTLSLRYQERVSEGEYEVIALDNGSDEPLGADFVEAFGSNFNYHYIDNALPSPAQAINQAIENAQGELIMCLIDGARMVTPGLVYYSLMAATAFARPFMYTLAWHLGDKLQNLSMVEGYNQETEDALLKTIDWQGDGYLLFDISVLAGSCNKGFFGGLPAESNCFAMYKSDYLRLGGLDENFASSGGGLVNLDFFKRALLVPELEPVMLLGEGSFHQFHGGAATNVPLSEHPWGRFAEEYERIRGEPFRAVDSRNPHVFGSMPSPALRFAGGR